MLQSQSAKHTCQQIVRKVHQVCKKHGYSSAQCNYTATSCCMTIVATTAVIQAHLCVLQTSASLQSPTKPSLERRVLIYQFASLFCQFAYLFYFFNRRKTAEFASPNDTKLGPHSCTPVPGPSMMGPCDWSQNAEMAIIILLQ